MCYTSTTMKISCGSKGGGHAPPVPVKTSHKKDGRHRRPLIIHVSCPPLTILDPMVEDTTLSSWRSGAWGVYI